LLTGALLTAATPPPSPPLLEVSLVHLPLPLPPVTLQQQRNPQLATCLSSAAARKRRGRVFLDNRQQEAHLRPPLAVVSSEMQVLQTLSRHRALVLEDSLATQPRVTPNHKVSSQLAHQYQELTGE
jgi:hypothetical protein